MIDNISEDAIKTLPDKSSNLIYGIEDLYEFDMETKINVIAITLRNFIGTMATKALKGNYFLIAEGKVTLIGKFSLEKNNKKPDLYPELNKLIKLLTPNIVKEIESIGCISIACLGIGNSNIEYGDIKHWEYHFLWVSNNFSYRAIGNMRNNGKVITQSYIFGEYNSGYISQGPEDVYFVKEDTEYTKPGSIIFFNDFEVLKGAI